MKNIEKFQVSQNTSEASLFGYNGPSRINTLQREQDMKIDTIEDQLKILTHVNNENVKQNEPQYKIIPLGEDVACREIPAYEPDVKAIKQERILKYFTDQKEDISGSVVRHLANIL